MNPHPPPRPTLLLITLLLSSLPILIHALGTGSTIAAIYGTHRTICGIIASTPTRRIECYSYGQKLIISIQPILSYDTIAAGHTFFCGLHSNGDILLCWNPPNFTPKRIFYTPRHRRNNTTTTTEDDDDDDDDDPLRRISIGSEQVIAISNRTNQLRTWRDKNVTIDTSTRFVSVTSGNGFSCGIVEADNTPGLVTCWGSNSSLAETIESHFRNISMSSIVAGGTHLCGFSYSDGTLLCGGGSNNSSGTPPVNERFTKLALGYDFTCGIRESNQTVVCWGVGMESSSFTTTITTTTSFELITAGSDFVCGLTSSNFTIICWGSGWGNKTETTPLTGILPGQCVDSSSSVCQCGIYPQSEQLCSNTGVICNDCSTTLTSPPPPHAPFLFTSPPPSPPPSSSSKSKSWKRGALLAFAIVGTIGTIAGILTVFYCLYTGGFFFNRKKIHNSVQPTITQRSGNSNPSNIIHRNSSNGSSSRHNNHNNSPQSSLRSMSVPRRQGSRITMMRRQRSGTSSSIATTKQHPDRAEEFTFQELAKATDEFSLENKIGAGSFGIVYRGKLPSDGREVAIKRGETSSKSRKYQEKETAFESEIAFLSRLHHKHLVRLVGYCEEREERLLVYDYMRNGALYDHLHGGRGGNGNGTTTTTTDEKENSRVMNTWKMRFAIALDAARGIEYLHNYAVPPIIHRDIKSSNILLDGNWVAKVSDFGLSLMGPDADGNGSGGGGFKPMKAAGTVGYMDPEYYEMNVLTAKSDVYGLGVVLLELLTGRRAIFRVSGEEDGGGGPTSVVDYAVPVIMEGELGRILDKRVGMPTAANEAEAVELVAYTALHCVHLEGKDRPSMTDIVANLERALGLCDESHGTISSASISVSSD